MLEFLDYAFMQRALIAGVFLSFLLALLGNFVSLRRMAFFSDGIAHASLAGVAVGIILSLNPLIVALISSALFALIIYFIETRYKIASDTAIGIIFTSGMALGVLLISFQKGYQPELMSFLFGNILSITFIELWIILILSFLVSIFLFKFLKPLTLLSLNYELAHVAGIKNKILQPILYVILALSIVLGIKVLGIILVSALLILPITISKIFAKSYKQLILWGIILSEIITLIGIILSYYANWPTGPTIVLTGTLIFLFASLFQLLKRSSLDK
jgi:zinc transport system permease protein